MLCSKFFSDVGWDLIESHPMEDLDFHWDSLQMILLESHETQEMPINNSHVSLFLLSSSFHCTAYCQRCCINWTCISTVFYLYMGIVAGPIWEDSEVFQLSNICFSSTAATRYLCNYYPIKEDSVVLFCFHSILGRVTLF